MSITVVDKYERDWVKIGDRVSIAPNVTFVTHSDPNESILRKNESLIKVGAITIHDDSWLGAQVTILPGVSIGARSIVAAGSVVTKDVAPDIVVAGVPARYLKSLK